MARPSKLTPDVQHAVCELLKRAVPIEVIFPSLQLSVSTHYTWMDAGRKAKSGKQHEYYLAVTAAMAETEAHILTGLHKAARAGNAAAARVLLPAVAPERWAHLLPEGRLPPLPPGVTVPDHVPGEHRDDVPVNDMAGL